MTARTLTLTDFLLARIAEDEAVAKATTPDDWVLHNDHDGVSLVADSWVDTTILAANWTRREDAAHVVRHAPNRVISECEAKRRIVEQARAWDEQGSRQGAQAIGSALRLLAWPYRDHPDYRAEWAV